MAGKFFDESHDRPDLLVGRPRQGKARHAGELDAVLHDPEELGWGTFLRHDLEIGGNRLQPFGPLGPIFVRRPTVTIDAADGRIGVRAGLHHRGILERSRRRVGCLPRHRGRPNVGQGPIDERRIVLVFGHAIEATEERDPRADGEEDRKRADDGQESHEPAPFRVEGRGRAKLRRRRCVYIPSANRGIQQRTGRAKAQPPSSATPSAIAASPGTQASHRHRHGGIARPAGRRNESLTPFG